MHRTIEQWKGIIEKQDGLLSAIAVAFLTDLVSYKNSHGKGLPHPDDVNTVKNLLGAYVEYKAANPYVLISGNPVDGFTFIGPFSGPDDTMRAGELLEGEWWSAALSPPSNVLDEGRNTPHDKPWDVEGARTGRMTYAGKPNIKDNDETDKG